MNKRKIPSSEEASLKKWLSNELQILSKAYLNSDDPGKWTWLDEAFEEIKAKVQTQEEK